VPYPVSLVAATPFEKGEFHCKLICPNTWDSVKEFLFFEVLQQKLCKIIVINYFKSVAWVAAGNQIIYEKLRLTLDIAYEKLKFGK